MPTHDLIGIGFGPSNIALAIALQEHPAARAFDMLFIERQPGFAWHPDMLLEHSHMQISFLKDLATLRNPTSRFTFINYLHEKQRLPEFINLKTFHPSRHEFNDYLAWAAAQFDDRCLYGEEVLEVLPVPPVRHGDEVQQLKVRSRDAAGRLQERTARNLIVSIGGTPHIPEPFHGLRGDARVIHSSAYRSDIERLGRIAKVAVIGAGQSAAELFVDLQGRPGIAQVDLVMRARSMRPSDDSPFVNEIFNAGFVDHVFARPEAERRELLREFRHTNYACPDLALIEQIYKRQYEQQVRGDVRHRLLRHQRIQSAHATPDGIELSLLDLDASHEHRQRYDAVVLATGYERRQHRALLEPLQPFLHGFEVDRHYRLRTTPAFRPAVFLQGACEDTHGLSDTLLSITAVRTGEISNALLQRSHRHGTVGAHTAGAIQPAA